MEFAGMNEHTIQEFRKGNAQAFATIFRLYYRPLCFFAINMINSRADAEDIVKDCFVKLWQKHADFDHQQTIRSFLYIATRNACLNFRRHIQVKKEVHEELIYLEENKEQELMLNQLIRMELMQAIYQEIEQMPEKRRQVFKLAYLESMKNDEIAEQLGISVFTVKEHKAKAISWLRTRFTDKQILLLLCLFADL